MQRHNASNANNTARPDGNSEESAHEPTATSSKTLSEIEESEKLEPTRSDNSSPEPGPSREPAPDGGQTARRDDAGPM